MLRIPFSVGRNLKDPAYERNHLTSWLEIGRIIRQPAANILSSCTPKDCPMPQIITKGIKALLPHVDDFRTVHNLASLGDLADALSKPNAGRAQNNRMEAA